MGTYNIEIEKNSQRINSLEDWCKLGGPKKENQWKDGRSAKELAKYILDGNGYLPKEIEDILLKIGCKSDKVFKCEPEKFTSLVGRGGGRNHDLYLEQSGEIVIGVEAKADETLGKLISEELDDKKISDNKINRINSLYESIYGCYPLDGGDIRYQLLTAMVGILLEAQRLHISKALLLIITFKKDGCYKEENINSNMEDINTFINSLERSRDGEKYSFSSYPHVDLYIENIEIDVK